MTLGTFYGIGVGPGPEGMLTVTGLAIMRRAHVILVPRSNLSEDSVAQYCVRNLGLPEERFRPVEFLMHADTLQLEEQYAELAREIAAELRAGRDVAYLTIGDSFTYSTYSYTLRAVQKEVPAARRVTLPGVTSYAAAAAALEFTLGEGKERTLILPCPEDMAALQRDIESHDVVVLMKIGHRFPRVLDLLRSMGIAPYCAMATRIGLPGEMLEQDLTQLEGERPAYLSTILIRRGSRA